jgi:choline dehydrogenase
MFPGDSVTDDDALLRAIESNLASYGHPTGTVPMGGPHEASAVVDSYGAVKEVEGLRVIDASIMPEEPTVATNPTVLMIAEHLAARAFGVTTLRDAKVESAA